MKERVKFQATIRPVHECYQWTAFFSKSLSHAQNNHSIHHLVFYNSGCKAPLPLDFPILHELELAIETILLLLLRAAIWTEKRIEKVPKYRN